MTLPSRIALTEQQHDLLWGLMAAARAERHGVAVARASELVATGLELPGLLDLAMLPANTGAVAVHEISPMVERVLAAAGPAWVGDAASGPRLLAHNDGAELFERYLQDTRLVWTAQRGHRYISVFTGDPTVVLQTDEELLWLPPQGEAHLSLRIEEVRAYGSDAYRTYTDDWEYGGTALAAGGAGGWFEITRPEQLCVLQVFGGPTIDLGSHYLVDSPARSLQERAVSELGSRWRIATSLPADTALKGCLGGLDFFDGDQGFGRIWFASGEDAADPMRRRLLGSQLSGSSCALLDEDDESFEQELFRSGWGFFTASGRYSISGPGYSMRNPTPGIAADLSRWMSAVYDLGRSAPCPPDIRELLEDET